MTPRATVAVLAYNQERHIADAVRGAFEQACEPVEILLSDDASTDGTFARMQALAAQYKGPHQVHLRRNDHNIGVGDHYNQIVHAARGSLICTMAGDDISLPNRLALTLQEWDRTGGKADLIACNLIDMDEDGFDRDVIPVDDLSQWRDAVDWTRRRPYIVGAGHTFTRRLFEKFGPLRAGVAYEDQVILLRALHMGGGRTVNLPLVRYRRGGLSGRIASMDSGTYRARHRRRIQQDMALHAQWLHDADIASCLPMMSAATREERQRARFLDQLLAASSLAERLKAVRDFPDLGVSLRFRKLLSWQWPELSLALKRLRS